MLSTYSVLAERFDSLLFATATSKSMCKHMFDVPYMYKTVDDPKTNLDRIESNRKLNGQKAKVMKRGKEAVAEDDKQGKAKKQKTTPRQPLQRRPWSMPIHEFPCVNEFRLELPSPRSSLYLPGLMLNSADHQAATLYSLVLVYSLLTLSQVNGQSEEAWTLRGLDRVRAILPDSNYLYHAPPTIPERPNMMEIDQDSKLRKPKPQYEEVKYTKAS